MMALWQVPAVVLALLAWLQAPPTTLADAARKEALRRQMVPKAAHLYTNEDLPLLPPRPEPPPSAEGVAGGPPVPPAAAATTPPGEPPADTKRDEAWWRDRMKTALEAIDRDQGLADAMQSRINALTTDWINRDDPVQQRLLFQQRQKALAELDRLTKQVEADRRAVDDIREDARRQGVPPGWIR